MVAVTLLCIFGVGALLTGRVSADDPCLCSSSQVGCCPAPNPVLYYKVMTSQWLSEHATLDKLNGTTPVSLHFKVPLFQRGELPTDDIIVITTLHLEDLPTSDSSFVLSICDGTVCNGFWIQDSGRYPQAASLYVTINSGMTYTNDHTASGGLGTPITYEHFPNTATLTFYPINKWASFSVPILGGYTAAGTFMSQVDVTNGLYLEAYGSEADEEYKVMFVEVKVIRNG